MIFDDCFDHKFSRFELILSVIWIGPSRGLAAGCAESLRLSGVRPELLFEAVPRTFAEAKPP